MTVKLRDTKLLQSSFDRMAEELFCREKAERSTRVASGYRGLGVKCPQWEARIILKESSRELYITATEDRPIYETFGYLSARGFLSDSNLPDEGRSIPLSPENINYLAGVMKRDNVRPDRPLVYVSLPRGSNYPVMGLDADELARQLVGIAYVVVEDRAYSGELKRASNMTNPYGGRIVMYLPEVENEPSLELTALTSDATVSDRARESLISIIKMSAMACYRCREISAPDLDDLAPKVKPRARVAASKDINLRRKASGDNKGEIAELRLKVDELQRRLEAQRNGGADGGIILPVGVEAYPGEARDILIRETERSFKSFNRQDRPRCYDMLRAFLDLNRVSDNGRMLEGELHRLARCERITDRELAPLARVGLVTLRQGNHRIVEYAGKCRCSMALTPEDPHTVTNDIKRLERMIT